MHTMEHRTVLTHIYRADSNVIDHQIHIGGGFVLVSYKTYRGPRQLLEYPGRQDRKPDVLAERASAWFERWWMSNSSFLDGGPEDLLEPEERLVAS